MICFDCMATIPPISEPSMCWPMPSRSRTKSAVDDAEGQQHRADLVREAADERLRLAAGALALLVHHAAQRLRHVVVAAAARPTARAAPRPRRWRR